MKTWDTENLMRLIAAHAPADLDQADKIRKKPAGVGGCAEGVRTSPSAETTKDRAAPAACTDDGRHMDDRH